MKHTFLIRLGGVAAVVGGVVYAGVGLLAVHLGEDLVFPGYLGYRVLVVSLPLGTMAAIVALYALHRERYGRAGAVLCLTAVLGLVLATGALTLRVLAAYPIHAFPDSGLFGWLIVLGLLVATAGMVLLGILSVAWRILPPWCAIALMVASPFVGVFFTLTASAAFSVLAGGAALLGRAFAALGGVPCTVVGYYIFRAAGQRTERPARVR